MTPSLPLPTRKGCRAVVLGGSLIVALATGLDRAEAPVGACGPFVEFTQFTSPTEPESREFFSGKLGILWPGYRLRYLVAAWRTLNGRPLTDAEREVPSFAPVPADQAHDMRPRPEPLDPVQAWLEVRRPLGFGDVPYGYRQEAMIEQPFMYFVNCNDAAFTTARKTLEARRQALGADNPEFRSWVVAQDVVFANCGRDSRKGPHIPDALPASASPLARADRDYQIAAALFYSGQLSAAERAFDAIGRDTTSPWQPFGRYLAARAILRQATIGERNVPDPAEFARARAALASIVADPAESGLRDAAERLLHYIDVRIHPADELALVARRLVTADPNPAHFEQDLVDFGQLLDRAKDDTSGYRSAPPDATAEELIDWVRTFSGRLDTAHGLERWRTTRRDQWLLATIAGTSADDPAVPELLAAARAVSADSTAYPTIAFHRARLLLLTGAADAARAALDAALQDRRGLSPSAVNQFRSARIQTARSLDEFLRDAVRTPVASWIDSDIRFVGTGRPAEPETYDRDAIDVINERMPLSVLRRITSSPLVPREMRPQIANAVFTRAVLIADASLVRTLIPETARAIPGLRSPLEHLASLEDDTTLLDEAWLLILSTPGMRPFVAAGGFRNAADLQHLDPLRDNWWCSFAPVKDHPNPYATQYWVDGDTRLADVQQVLYRKPGDLPPVTFLTAEEKDARRAETAHLEALGPAATELVAHAIDWAERHRDDPRAPRVLAQAVRAGHLGCGDETTWPLSKKAFTLLHQRYPLSVWAKKTPYWYR